MSIKKVEVDYGDLKPSSDKKIKDKKSTDRKLRKDYKLEISKKTYSDKYKVNLNIRNSSKYEVIELKYIWIIINSEIYKEISNFSEDKMIAYFKDTDLTTMLETCWNNDIDEAKNCMKRIFNVALASYNFELKNDRSAPTKNENNNENIWNGIKF